jgi:hypothetical protein
MTSTAADVMAALAAQSNPDKAAGLSRFFKTGPGEYGEGDVFLGLTVPTSRTVVKSFGALHFDQIDLLLNSAVHEHRFAGLLILVSRYPKAPSETAEFYLAAVRRQRVNNWDLVDCSAEFILGEFYYERPRSVLFELAASDSVWERRVAMLSTFGFIKHGDAPLPSSSRKCCCQTGTTSFRRRWDGCCARSVNALTGNCLWGFSMGTRHGCHGRRCPTRPSTSRPCSASTIGQFASRLPKIQAGQPVSRLFALTLRWP